MENIFQKRSHLQNFQCTIQMVSSPSITSWFFLCLKTVCSKFSSSLSLLLHKLEFTCIVEKLADWKYLTFLYAHKRITTQIHRGHETA